jgi:putative peptidoglycan lipid II flippase
MHDMRTPAIVGVTSIALNALVAWLLMPVLGNMGISLATSLVSCYNFLALYLIFRRRTGYAPSDHAKQEILKAVTAGIILTGLLAIIKMAFFGRPYLSFAASTLVTLVIYGFFFKDYYVSLLRRRPGTGSAE